MTDLSSYFLPELANKVDLKPWADLLPNQVRILRTNLFGDVMLADRSGQVHMLERGAGVISLISPSEEDFWRRADRDEDGWELRPLVDKCRAAGKALGAHQCYGFTTLPVFGGTYTEDNVWVCAWAEWFSFTGDIYNQTKSIPDGTKIILKVVD
jgi:hypothetical protein